MNIEHCRSFYAEEIKFVASLKTPGLFEAFARVPREKFLGAAPWEIASPEARAMSMQGAVKMSFTTVDDPRQIYHNVLVALDKAGDINNGQPSALGRWIDALGLKAGDRAFHLGCGVGYYTAIITEVVGRGGNVVGIDVNLDLAARAKENLSRYPNVTAVAGDGATFDPGDCDAMLINAGTTHPLPLWLDRLREGGRLVVPITMATSATVGIGVMTKIIRRGEGYSAEVVTPLGIYSCTSARDPQREPLVRAAMSGGALMKIKSIRRDVHEKAETCLVHASDVCLSGAEVG